MLPKVENKRPVDLIVKCSSYSVDVAYSYSRHSPSGKLRILFHHGPTTKTSNISLPHIHGVSLTDTSIWMLIQCTKKVIRSVCMDYVPAAVSLVRCAATAMKVVTYSALPPKQRVLNWPRSPVITSGSTCGSHGAPVLIGWHFQFPLQELANCPHTSTHWRPGHRGNSRSAT